MSSSVIEQLRSPVLPEIIKVFDIISSESVRNFYAQLEDFDRYVKDGKSNVDFLSLLERHFRNLQTCQLQAIVNSIYPLSTTSGWFGSISISTILICSLCRLRVIASSRRLRLTC